MRDLEILDSELRLVAVLRRSARERGGPLPSISVADALLDERRELNKQLQTDRPGRINEIATGWQFQPHPLPVVTTPVA